MPPIRRATAFTRSEKTPTVDNVIHCLKQAIYRWDQALRSVPDRTRLCAGNSDLRQFASRLANLLRSLAEFDHRLVLALST